MSAPRNSVFFSRNTEFERAEGAKSGQAAVKSRAGSEMIQDFRSCVNFVAWTIFITALRPMRRFFSVPGETERDSERERTLVGN